jgi:hypothetical protein
MPQDPPPAPHPAAPKRWNRLRTLGLAVWLLGLAAAGIVYWSGRHSANPEADALMTGYSAPESRQMGVLYGKMGLMIQDFSADLKEPGTQAELIAGAATAFGLGCLYLARGGEQPRAD